MYNELLKKEKKLAVIGMGYVGMPIAVAFSKKIDVIGFDINSEKIECYKSGIDPTQEVGNEEIQKCKVYFTSDEKNLKNAKFHIIAVPTPVNLDKTPDLSPVIGASTILGRNLTKGSVVVYESTVYPGVTEDICIPILEKESGLSCGRDFFVGYSPERINPGDKVHRLENIKKIVSGMDKKTLNTIAKVYELIIEAGVYRAGSIKVAEAAKVVENSQRDINIAFMNELAMAFNKMGIDTQEVVDAMNTKWNALGFTPGLVGGHCIGVDPYYFIYEAEKLGYHSQIISAGRKINDGMGEFVADNIIKELSLANLKIKGAKVVVLGITFKENCPDSRNTKVIDIIERLKEFGVSVYVVDPYVDKKDVLRNYNIRIYDIKEINDVDCFVFAVAHSSFKEIPFSEYEQRFHKADNCTKVIIDIKSILNKEEVLNRGYRYWRL